MGKEIDLTKFPSWKYYSWGLFNGLIFGIIIRHGVDISEGGITTLILEALKPLIENLGASTFWLSFLILSLSVIGAISLIAEVYIIYSKGWPQRIIAASGFLSFLLLIIGRDSLGVVFLFLGAIMVRMFPED